MFVGFIFIFCCFLSHIIPLNHIKIGRLHQPPFKKQRLALKFLALWPGTLVLASSRRMDPEGRRNQSVYISSCSYPICHKLGMSCPFSDPYPLGVWCRVVSLRVVSCGVVSVVTVRILAQAHFFDPPEPQIIVNTQCFATFLPFRAPASSFLSPFLFSDLLASSLLFSDSSRLCFSICPSCKKFDFETSFACIHF